MEVRRILLHGIMWLVRQLSAKVDIIHMHGKLVSGGV